MPVEQNLKKEHATPFEEALRLTGVGRYNYFLLSTTIFSLLASTAEIFSLGIVVTASQCDLELDVTRKGIIGSVPMLGFLISAHFWGYLADTKGRRFTLAITMSGTVFFAVVSGFSTDWIFMAVAKFFSAMCASGTNAVRYALLGESTPDTHRSRYLLFAATGIFLVQAVNVGLAYPTLNLNFFFDMPLLGISYRPWRLLTQIIGALSAVDLIFLLLSYESAKFYFANGENENGLTILKTLYKINQPTDQEKGYMVSEITLQEESRQSKNMNIFKSMWNQTVPLFHKKHVKNTLLISYVSVVTYCVAPPLVMWLPEIFNNYSNSLEPNASFCSIFQTNKTEEINTMVCDDIVSDTSFQALGLFALYMTAVCVGSLLVVHFLGKKWTFIIVHVLSALSCVLVDQFNSTVGVMLLVGAMSSAVSMGLVTAYAVELFPTYMRAMAVCLTIMVGRSMSFIVINIIGTQLLTNCSNFLIYLGALIFSGAMVGYYLPSDKRHITGRSQAPNNAQ